MEAAVLDEYLVCARPSQQDSSNINPSHVALQGLRIARRTFLIAQQLDARARQKLKVRMVSRQRKDEIILQFNLVLRRLQDDRIRCDLTNSGIEARGDLAIFDAVLNIRIDPVL